MKIEVLSSKDLDIKKWNKFVIESCNGSVFNTMEWVKLWESRGCNGLFILLKEGDSITAGLPIIEVKRFGFRNYYSMPYGAYGGVLTKKFSGVCDKIKEEEARVQRAEIISKLIGLAKGKFGIIGISDFSNGLEGCGIERLGFRKVKYKTHLLELSCDEKVLWKNCLTFSTKAQVKQADKFGIKVESITCEDEIRECYKMYEETAHKHGNKHPEFPIEFYYEIFRVMKSFLRWTIARKGDNIVANAIHFIFNGTIIWWAGASYKTSLHYRPNNALVWDAIKWGCGNGYKYYNLGGSPSSAVGLRKFKQSWGAIEKEYWFYYKKSRGFKMLNVLRDILNVS